jgi:hypothetical protein
MVRPPKDAFMLDPAEFVSEPAAGRSCGSCTLCCKVFDVPALEKPAGSWCTHCTPGRGCGIHETRPQHCRSFHCLWMTQAWLGPEWKPDRAKMVLTIDPTTNFLFVQLDPGHPGAWKREPYYSHLKAMSEAWLRLGRHVLVFLKKSATVVLPDGDVALGVFAPGDRLVARQRATPTGTRIEVEKVSAAVSA